MEDSREEVASNREDKEIKEMRVYLDLIKGSEHVIFWRKLSRKIDKTTREELHNKNMESDHPIVNKKT